MNFEDMLKSYQLPRPKGAKHSIRRIDKYDQQDMDEMRKQVNPYRVARTKLCKVAENTGGHLTEDTTMGFFKVQPEMEDPENMDPRYLLNRAVQEKLQGTPDWERLRSWTAGDKINTAMAFADIEPVLEELFDRTQKEAEERAQAVEEALQRLEELQRQSKNLEDLIEQWQKGGVFDPDGPEVEGGQEAQEALQQQIADAQAQLDQAQADAQGQADAAAGEAVPGLRQAMGETADKCERTAAMTNSFGMDPGQLQRMPAKERIELANRLDNNERFKRLAQLIGPMMRLASAEQTRKVYHSFEEVYDIEAGRELSRLVPSELMDLLRPETKLHFYRKWMEGQTLQYAMRGDEKVGKGGIIMEIDNSGSMAGDREVWAKAVGLATAAIAKDQKRSFYGVHFGSGGYGSYKPELMTFDFRDWNKVTFDQMIDYAEFFFGGGTDFMAPLSLALKLLQDEEREKGFTEGDIVFVTDGICSVTPDWLKMFSEERERLGFKVWGIIIGGARTSEPLNSICDGNVVTIQDLLTGDEVRKMFREL